MTDYFVAMPRLLIGKLLFIMLDFDGRRRAQRDIQATLGRARG